MIPTAGPALFRPWLWVLGAAALAGCLVPGAQPIVGPDGSPMLHVHCGSEQSECFRLAGEQCPAGYDYAPVYDARDGNFLVRCRGPMRVASPALVAAAPPPVPTSVGPVYAAPPPPAPAPSASTSESDWPPADIGKATEPWKGDSAGAVSSGAPAGALPPTPRTKLGDVDVGY